MFKIDDSNRIVVDPNELMVPQIKVLWDRDTTKNKETFYKEAAYLYFLCNYKSPYNNYRDADKREKLATEIFNNPEFKPDTLLETAITEYNKLKRTVIIHFLDSAQEAIFILSDRLRDPFAKTKEITDSISKIKEVMINFDSLRQAAEKEISSKSLSNKDTKRGSREIPKQFN